MPKIVGLIFSCFVLLSLAACTGDATQVVEVTRLVPQTIQVTVLTTPVQPGIVTQVVEEPAWCRKPSRSLS